MALKIRHIVEADAPSRGSSVADDEVALLRTELAKLGPGTVLVVETGDASAVRATKFRLTRAGQAIGRPVTHWHVGTVVYAKAAEVPKRRGRPPKVTR